MAGEGYSQAVVSYRNSTSNHNFTPCADCQRIVVSYRNSTSNHNTITASKNGYPVVSYRNSTSNHNLKPYDVWVSELYLIEILHQTTTWVLLGIRGSSCILSKFYIKPQLSTTPPKRKSSCILSKFYIKPQRQRLAKQIRRVVSYRNSTSNHNLGDELSLLLSVVSYRNSTSNHNNRSSHNIGQLVVSYRNSTSNHNCPRWSKTDCMLYLIEILHQTTTILPSPSWHPLLYLIEILHQTTTLGRRSRHGPQLYLIEILHQTTTSWASCS